MSLLLLLLLFLCVDIAIVGEGRNSYSSSATSAVGDSRGQLCSLLPLLLSFGNDNEYIKATTTATAATAAAH